MRRNVGPLDDHESLCAMPARLTLSSPNHACVGHGFAENRSAVSLSRCLIAGHHWQFQDNTPDIERLKPSFLR